MHAYLYIQIHMYIKTSMCTCINSTLTLTVGHLSAVQNIFGSLHRVVNIYTQTHKYIHIYACIFKYVYIYINKYIYTYINLTLTLTVGHLAAVKNIVGSLHRVVNIYIQIHIYIYIYMYTYVHLNVYIIYVYIHTYMHTNTHRQASCRREEYRRPFSRSLPNRRRTLETDGPRPSRAI